MYRDRFVCAKVLGLVSEAIEEIVEDYKKASSAAAPGKQARPRSGARARARLRHLGAEQHARSPAEATIAAGFRNNVSASSYARAHVSTFPSGPSRGLGFYP
jgi:hypothetical protein